MTDELDDADLERYARHAILDEIGEEGQARLLRSRICVIGAGGLGSPVLLYLAAAGVGTLGIVDFDTVDRTNLQRQVAHTDDAIGRPKVESAAERIAALNPTIDVRTHNLRLDADNAGSILGAYDLVVDGTDDFAVRQVVNDACYRQRIPLVSGSVVRFEGQVATFKAYETGPCYRCLFDRELGPGAAPRCDTAGVLGPVAGVIGTLQAVEAIKVLLDLPGHLVGRMLMVDAQDPSMRVYKTRRDPDCPVCGAGAPSAEPADTASAK
ncbi:MAG: molybdopterin-synthase adenylyltransferase MoeB [Alphaproteobacteria bacterium]|nr:molybdopterin-synthase adenylyltransferase MoeB [Alphaproteobacteria bacterium]